MGMPVMTPERELPKAEVVKRIVRDTRYGRAQAYNIIKARLTPSSTYANHALFDAAAVDALIAALRKDAE